MVRGKGSRVEDSKGNTYIDMLAGIAVNSLGHCHPEVVAAVREQVGKLMHCTNIYYNEPQAKLAKLLVDASDLDRVFFCNSGTEAVEGAIKLARKWASKNGRGGKIISMDGSFHGRTLGALMATGQKKYRNGLDPLLTGFEIIPFNDIEAVERAVDDETCAIILEPVQGEGGIRIATKEYMTALRKICDERDILLIFDEIQCGLGRTGYLFAYQACDVIPDIITLAKALGGGFPIGALLAKEDFSSAFEPGDHGTTFGGNPLATAAAYASLSTIIHENLSERSREMGEYLMHILNEKTKEIKAVSEIRGRGLMVGVELDGGGKDVVNAMLEKGVLGNCTADKVIRFVPPLNIPKKYLDRAIEVFIESLKEVYPDE